MAEGGITFTVVCSQDDARRGFESLVVIASELPEVADKIRDYVLPGGDLRPGLVGISSAVSDVGPRELLVHLELTDEFRELVRALAAGEFGGDVSGC